MIFDHQDRSYACPRPGGTGGGFVPDIFLHRLLAQGYMQEDEIADRYRTFCPVLFFFAGWLLNAPDAGRGRKGDQERAWGMLLFREPVGGWRPERVLRRKGVHGVLLWWL